MLYNYINGLFERQKSFDHVIYIKKEELKSVKSLQIEYSSHYCLKVEKINLSSEFSPATKYDLTNIRSLSKHLKILFNVFHES